MPLNTLRLNHQKSSHPNDRVVFIKPLPRPASEQTDYDLADTFLRAIAAQCLPLMKKHYLSVTTLEEYEPNPEFIGRNFNNGEIIQLVLRSKSGQWVPFNMVQMVMMHELAHNTHMNHGKLFWQARNLYADEMKALWTKGYTGEGFWGTGRTLNEMGNVMGNNILSSQELESLPLCGGTYRSRKRKRKAGGPKSGPELTWKEKRDRRIERKFGKNGVALGEDEDQRLALEIKRRGPIGGKPRVAQSKRGRELRAAAALARFETNKMEVENLQTGDGNSENDADDGSDDSFDDTVDAGQEDALDVNGKKLLDSKGQGMVRVCDDEDTDDINVKQEMTDLENLHRYFKLISISSQRSQPGVRSTTPHENHWGQRHQSPVTRGEIPKSDEWNLAFPEEANRDVDEAHHLPTASSALKSSSEGRDLVSGTASRLVSSNAQHSSPSKIAPSSRSLSNEPSAPSASSSSFPQPQPTVITPTTIVDPDQRSSPSTPPAKHETATSTSSDIAPASTDAVVCPICSLENPRLNATCLACAHVIDTSKDSRHWSCKSEACRNSATAYLNAGDAGVCGVCGASNMR